MRGFPKNGRLLVIVGPTGVGKTSLSLWLAEFLEIEIVSADSRLFYKGLDIGTDKPSLEDRARVPHHLIDYCLPDDTLTLGQYQKLAYKAIGQILERGRLPVLVGGTGQYIKSLVEGWGIPTVAPQQSLRSNLEQLDPATLFRWLQVLDPISASRIDHRNLRRIIRALEVTLVMGKPISEVQKKQKPELDIKIVGLTCERQVLYDRIDARVDEMIEKGLIQEVTKLRSAGYHSRLPSMSGLGYQQLFRYLEGEYSLDEAIERIKFETHRFVRQQYSWFGLSKPSIQWFDVLHERWEMRLQEDVLHWLAGTMISEIAS